MYDVTVWFSACPLIHVYKTSYPSLECACGARAERPQMVYANDNTSLIHQIKFRRNRYPWAHPLWFVEWSSTWKHHRFWGARALGSWQSIQIACRLQESVREDTGRRVIHVVRRELTARSHVLVSWSVYPNYEYHYCRDLEASQHVIGLDCGLLVGHNAVWSPNFYMLCSDLLSVVNRKFGISYGWFPV